MSKRKSNEPEGVENQQTGEGTSREPADERRQLEEDARNTTISNVNGMLRVGNQYVNMAHVTSIDVGDPEEGTGDQAVTIRLVDEEPRVFDGPLGKRVLGAINLG